MLGRARDHACFATSAYSLAAGVWDRNASGQKHRQDCLTGPDLEDSTGPRQPHRKARGRGEVGFGFEILNMHLRGRQVAASRLESSEHAVRPAAIEVRLGRRGSDKRAYIKRRSIGFLVKDGMDCSSSCAGAGV